MNATRVFMRPVGLHSPAMIRVSNALERHMPTYVRVAGSPSPNYCDIQVLHVISHDAIEYAARLRAAGTRYIAIQYCLRTAGGNPRDWIDMWSGAEFVWSYYDLEYYYFNTCAHIASEHLASADHVLPRVPFRFMRAPLGIDDTFLPTPRHLLAKEPMVVTTGHVSGAGAEPIAQVWEAARRVGMRSVHIGPPRVAGTDAQPDASYQGIADESLANIYRRARFVAAMRHVEGFELPAAEALACGTRPIVFDQPAMRTWYDGLATFVPDTCGDSHGLVTYLANTFHTSSSVVTDEMRAEAVNRFDWSVICRRFWSMLGAESSYVATRGDIAPGDIIYGVTT